MLRITAALFFLSPVLANAQCLQPEDLNTGIVVEYGSGNISHISRTGDGTIMNAYENLDSYYQEMFFFESHNGVFDVRRVWHEKGRWDVLDDVRISYDQSVEATGSFSAGDFGNATVTQSSSDRGDSNASFGWRTYEGDPLVIGECSYETVRIFTTEFDARRGDIYIREVRYLTDLGFGIQTANSDYGLPTNDTDIVGLSAL